MDISKSDIIISLAGRDKGQYFYVIDVEENYVLWPTAREGSWKIPNERS